MKEEKPWVDGVQLRRLVLGPDDIPVSYVPQTSPFIHRDTNYYVFEDLQPNTKYEVDLDLIPIPEAAKELYSGKKIEFRTPPEIDVYNFTPKIMILNTTHDSVEVGWTGVPRPDQDYQIWLEAYLTNGKIAQSNVIDFQTQPVLP